MTIPVGQEVVVSTRTEELTEEFKKEIVKTLATLGIEFSIFPDDIVVIAFTHGKNDEEIPCAPVVIGSSDTDGVLHILTHAGSAVMAVKAQEEDMTLMQMAFLSRQRLEADLQMSEDIQPGGQYL